MELVVLTCPTGLSIAQVHIPSSQLPLILFSPLICLWLQSNAAIRFSNAVRPIQQHTFLSRHEHASFSVCVHVTHH